MRVSQLFTVTQRETPKDINMPGQQLLIQAGYIRFIGAGIFSMMPLGKKSVEKIKKILREEMDGIGGQEISMPVVHPADTWKSTGRWDTVDQSLVRFKDRHERDMVIAMTHEEIVAFLSTVDIRSYKQLPKLVYQIQTKFRDEARPRGGLIRVREFEMKDSYSLDMDEAGLQIQYDTHYQAYLRIFNRCQLPVKAVESDTGMMGGRIAHEFMYLDDNGEDNLIFCSNCDYAANQEAAEFNIDVAELAENADSKLLHIEDASILSALERTGMDLKHIVKPVFMRAFYARENKHEYLAVFVPAQLTPNAVKIMKFLNASDVALTSLTSIISDETAKCGQLDKLLSEFTVIVDESLVSDGKYAVFIEELKQVYTAVKLKTVSPSQQKAPVSAAGNGSFCIKCGESLAVKKGIEVANIFQLGTKYSEALGATFMSNEGKDDPIIMGSYGIGVGRLLGCLAEEFHDEKGLKLPISVAPYQVSLVVLSGKNSDDSLMEFSDNMYQTMLEEGIEVLYDDRLVAPGIKFADSDLIGTPVRVVISSRNYKNRTVEIKLREDSNAELVSIEEAIAAIKERISLLVKVR